MNSEPDERPKIETGPGQVGWLAMMDNTLIDASHPTALVLARGMGRSLVWLHESLPGYPSTDPKRCIDPLYDVVRHAESAHSYGLLSMPYGQAVVIAGAANLARRT